MSIQDRHNVEDALRDRFLARLKEKGEELRALLEQMERHWGIEDGVYRFYHQSLKVYYAQEMTQEAVELLQSLLPERPLNAWFMQIVKEGTGKSFELSHNENWLHHTRPMIEALFHAHYFVKMACKYGQELEAQPAAWPVAMRRCFICLICGEPRTHSLLFEVREPMVGKHSQGAHFSPSTFLPFILCTKQPSPLRVTRNAGRRLTLSARLALQCLGTARPWRWPGASANEAVH